MNQNEPILYQEKTHFKHQKSSYLVLRKLISSIKECPPRLCPTLPGALGTFNRDCRLKAPAFPGMVAHVPGHKYSCSWVQSGNRFYQSYEGNSRSPRGGEPHPVLFLFAPFGGRKNTTCDSAAKYPNPKIYTDFWDCNPKILYDFWD